MKHVETRYVDAAGLAKEAQRVVDDQPMNQSRFAEMLGVRHSSVSRAINPASSGLTKLRIRILEMAGMTVSGPYYQINENTIDDQRGDSGTGKKAGRSRGRPRKRGD